MSTIYISAKDLGKLVMPDFSARSFWYYMKIDRKPPFNTFPGIFSSFDALNKRMVHACFDELGHPPAWFKPMGDIAVYHKPLRSSYHHEATDILLTGEPDAVFETRDGKVVIADYKTARLTKGQDDLHPLYTAQLNVYNYFRVVAGLEPATALWLIYLDPQTICDPPDAARMVSKTGYRLDFKAEFVRIPVKPEKYITELLERVRKICDLKKPPKQLGFNKDCERIEKLLALATAGVSPSKDGVCFEDMLSFFNGQFDFPTVLDMTLRDFRM